MARPRVDERERRKAKLACACTAEEAEEIRRRAEAAGISPSAFLRSAALGRRLPPPPAPALNQEAWARLGRLLGGLASVAQAAGRGQVLDWTEADSQLVAEIKAEVQALRAELLGAVHGRE